MRRALSAVIPLLLLASTAHAGAVGYAQATGYYKKDTRPTLYQPLNVLDSREGTAWCSTSGDYLVDALTFGFKGLTQIDEIRVYTGNGFDADTFQTFSRARKLRVIGPDRAHELTINDQRGLQAISISPPISADHVALEVMDIYVAEDPDMPVCLSDVVFYSGGKPLNGPWLTPKLKYDRTLAPVLGTWYAGHDGAPNRWVSFFFDRTYRVVYDPYDGKGRTFTGSFEMWQGKARFEVPGKGNVHGEVTRGKKTDARGKSYRTLELSGNLPEDLKQTFRERRIVDARTASDFP